MERRQPSAMAMNAHPVLSIFVIVVGTLMAACDSPSGEEELRTLDPPQFNHVGHLATGTAVYLGRGLVLTNWHVCSQRMDVIAYNAPEDGGTRYREGASLDGWTCNDSEAVFQEKPPIEVGRACSSIATNTRIGLELGSDRMIPPHFGFLIEPVFAQRAIDVCIMRFRDERIPATVHPDDLLLIDTKPVVVGQEVVVGGYPGAARNAIIERCRVTRGTELVRDPDLINPSDLVVPSFAIDCKTPKHGSSGSPVLDAQTGLLLGLLWTGEYTTDGVSGLHYASAASSWRSAQNQRPIEQYSQLDEMLRNFAAP